MIIGLVGKANVGKSTFFKALTMAEVVIANYPFATIKPNKGFGFVKVDCVDKEFGTQCNPRFGYCLDGWRFVPVEVIDVAGLVPGAHEGKGMGNQFLDDLRQADALIHVVDVSGSTNEKGEPVEPGSYDPLFDIKFLEFELDMWFLAILKKGWDRFARQVQQEHTDIVKALAKQLSGLNVNEEMVKQGIKGLGLDPAKPIEWPENKIQELAVFLRKKTKPMLVAANKIDLASAQKNLERVKKQHPDIPVVPCSAESELALKEAAKKQLINYVPGENNFTTKQDLPEKQQKALEFIKQNILEKHGSTGVQQAFDKTVFDLLNHIAVFPGGVHKLADQHGNVLPDCFLLPAGSTALEFAERIHTDLAKKFVAAVDVRTKRKIGKDQPLKHRDVIEVLTSK